jgi:GcrA cell cycle regulator
MNQHQTPWTAERDAQLRSLWDAGISGTEIGKRMGITKSAAIGRVHRLKLAPRVSPIATITKAWTEEEDARLRQLYGGFLNVDQIGQKLDRSPASIRYRAVHLGLVSKKGSAEHRARLSGAQRKRASPAPRVATTSAAPPSARGGRASFPPPEPDLPGVAPEMLQQRRVFSGKQCKMVVSGDDEPLRFCSEPVIASAKGQHCASPYCLAHYAAAYIGTNKDLGEPNKLRWGA